MKRRPIFQLILGAALLALFVLFTWALTFADVRPIGPNGSSVAFAGVNRAVHELFGVHMVLYEITDWAGVAAIAIALGFAVLGLVQWIGRRSIRKVDASVLLLGAFYILVFGVYAFFEFRVINRRPVLIEGVLEASYPSSTTVLVMCVVPTAMMQFRRLIKRRRLCIAVNTLCALFTAAVVIGRLISGVHWLTDIIGGALFSAGAALLYRGAAGLVSQNGKA